MFEQPPDALLEVGRLGQAVVEHVSIGVVELPAFRPSTQQVAEEQVFNPPGLQGVADRLLVEVRGVARVGAAADIDQQRNPMLSEQVEELLQRMIGMADRPDGPFR